MLAVSHAQGRSAPSPALCGPGHAVRSVLRAQRAANRPRSVRPLPALRARAPASRAPPLKSFSGRLRGAFRRAAALCALRAQCSRVLSRPLSPPRSQARGKKPAPAARPRPVSRVAVAPRRAAARSLRSRAAKAGAQQVRAPRGLLSAPLLAQALRAGVRGEIGREKSKCAPAVPRRPRASARGQHGGANAIAPAPPGPHTALSPRASPRAALPGPGARPAPCWRGAGLAPLDRTVSTLEPQPTAARTRAEAKKRGVHKTPAHKGVSTRRRHTTVSTLEPQPTAARTRAEAGKGEKKGVPQGCRKRQQPRLAAQAAHGHNPCQQPTPRRRITPQPLAAVAAPRCPGRRSAPAASKSVTAHVG